MCLGFNCVHACVCVICARMCACVCVSVCLIHAASETYEWRVQTAESLRNGTCLIDKKYTYDPGEEMMKSCHYEKECNKNPTRCATDQ